MSSRLVKTWTRRTLGVALIATSVGLAQAAEKMWSWNFAKDLVGKPPVGFQFDRTGDGPQGIWVVQSVPGAPGGSRVLAQIDRDKTDYRFPLAVAESVSFKDGSVSVKCKSLAGDVDRACGVVIRYRDAGRYYLARANALENNVRFYRVIDGKREQIAGWNGVVRSDVWNSLRMDANGTSFKVTWNGQPVISATDATISAPGTVGVWTKADSVTQFAQLAARER